jgi:hypothetical protein
VRGHCFERHGGKPCHKGMVEVVFQIGHELISAGWDSVIRVWDFTTIDTAETNNTQIPIELTPKYKLRFAKTAPIKAMNRLGRAYLVTGKKDGDPFEQLWIFCEVPQQAPMQTHESQRDYLQKMAKENIRHFSHANWKEKEIHDWGEAQDPAQSIRAFILGIPVSVIRLIHRRIVTFSHEMAIFTNKPPTRSFDDAICF